MFSYTNNTMQSKESCWSTSYDLTMISKLRKQKFNLSFGMCARTILLCTEFISHTAKSHIRMKVCTAKHFFGVVELNS